MAGGTWTVQNKVRPGVYVNVESKPSAAGTLGERGIASLALVLPWGEPHRMLRLEAGGDTRALLGYDLTAPQMLLVREALKRAGTLLLYRLNEGTAASASHEELTVTARYGGARGNDLSVAVQANVDSDGMFDVITYLEGREVDRQLAANIDDLQSNGWVTFSGTGELTDTAGVPLAGGDDGTATNGAHTDYLAALELEEFNTAGYVGTDNTLKGVYAAFARRMREDEGKKIQVVVANYPEADYEGVISVKNGVILADGTALNAGDAVAWTAAATAAAAVNESLTYTAYDDAVDANPRYTNSQIIAALQAGEFVFTANDGRAVVEQDINTLTGFTPEKSKAFAKNRVVRVLDGLGNDLVRIFTGIYLGKVPNDANGRNLLKSECINLVQTMQDIGAVQNFDSQSDIRVLPGADTDAVLIEADVQPVDSVEKIYVQVQVG